MSEADVEVRPGGTRRATGTLARWYADVSRPTTSLPRAERRRAALVALAGLVFLMLPRVSGWTALHVHKEDGSIFLQDFLAHGWSSTFDTYTGYLHVLARVVVGAAATLTGGHPDLFPFVVGLLVALVRVAVFWLVLVVLRPYAASPGWALVAAGSVLVLPVGQYEVLGNVTNLRWVLVPAAAFGLLAVARTTGVVVLAAATCVLAALGDPLMVLLVPAAVLRLVTVRGRVRVPALAFLVAAAVHLWLLEPGARGAEPYPLDHPVGSVGQWLVRGPVTAVYGITGSEGLLRVGGVALALAALVLPVVVVVAALRRTPGIAPLVVLLVVSAEVLLALTLSFADYADISLNTWYAVAVPSRYAVAPAVLLLPALTICLGHLLAGADTGRMVRLAARLTVAAVVVAVLLDFRGDPYNTQGPGWPAAMDRARQACRDGVTSVVVEVTPTGVPTRWDARVTCDWVR